jgi:hypothetical protein
MEPLLLDHDPPGTILFKVADEYLHISAVPVMAARGFTFKLVAAIHPVGNV